MRSTRGGESLTGSVAIDRRDRTSDGVYIALVPSRAQEVAAQHLVKVQAVVFSGRFEPREYTTRDGRDCVADDLHDVALEYGAKPRREERAAASPEGGTEPDDIPSRVTPLGAIGRKRLRRRRG